MAAVLVLTVRAGRVCGERLPPALPCALWYLRRSCVWMTSLVPSSPAPTAPQTPPPSTQRSPHSPSPTPGTPGCCSPRISYTTHCPAAHPPPRYPADTAAPYP